MLLVIANEDMNNKPQLNKQIILLGFGIIGQALLPLIFKHFKLNPSQITIIDKETRGAHIAKEYGILMEQNNINATNYMQTLGALLDKDTILINLSTSVSGINLVSLCQKKDALYLDTAPMGWDWANLASALHDSQDDSLMTIYNYREILSELKKEGTSTAIMWHGANPGLVSHFTKQALCNIAEDNGLTISTPTNSEEWASLAQCLGIKAIHIAERDSQITNYPKKIGEFSNSWSSEGLIMESSMFPELGWGTHERHWPDDACDHKFGSKSAIYLKKRAASVKVRTWTPTFGPFHGFLIPHPESISIANYLTLKQDDNVVYRPTVHFSYMPCPYAELSLYEFASNEWVPQSKMCNLVNDIVDGRDELGVLLMGNQKGAYWYGSQLTIQETRDLVPYNNATSLQVACAVLAGICWAIEHPREGIVEPEDLDHQSILDICIPYLGTVAGYYTDWNPLKNRERLINDQIDVDDPWQFINIRV
jgi:homospermidine synthase